MSEELPPLNARATELLRRPQVTPLSAAAKAQLLTRIAASVDVAAALSAGAGAAAGAGAGAVAAKTLTLGKVIGLAALTSVLGAAVSYVWVRSQTPPPAPPPHEVVVAAPTPPTPAPPVEVREEVPPVPPVETPEVVAPPAPPHRAELPTDNGLAKERMAIERARSALMTRDASAALEAVALHRKQFPRGQLAEERERIHVQALVLAGRITDARTVAADFHRSFPDSVFGPSVDALLDGGAMVDH